MEEIENATKRTEKKDDDYKQLHIRLPKLIFENFVELLPEGTTPTDKIETLITQFVFDQKIARGDKNDTNPKKR